jgi:hypothetical protein
VALDLGLHLGLGSGGPPPGLSAPANSVAPAITGEAIVGHTLYSDTGTWSGSPAYSRQWYADDVAISGATADYYIIQDTDDGAVIHCTVTASNAAGSDSEPSNDTAAVAFPDPDAPVLARTSASGAAPMVWERTLAANVYPGYRLMVSAAEDAGIITLLWQGYVILTQGMIDGTDPLDLETNGIPELGFDAYDPTQTGWPSQVYIEEYVFAITPQGAIYESDTSDLLQKTDALTPIIWNSSDKTATVTLSESGLLATVIGNPGSPVYHVRATEGVESGELKYFEYEIVATGNRVGVADDAADITINWATNPGDVHAALYQGASGSTTCNGTTVAESTFTAGDVIGIHVNGTTDKIYWAKNDVDQNGDPASGVGGMNIASLNFPIKPGLQMSANASARLCVRSADLNYTPRTGYTPLDPS